jgi:tRNA (uracil-5-)-methyltransferase TRM9
MEDVNDNNLKNVYENIATAFDKTRYRSWSTVERILDTFKQNTLNGDIGCGNGKNMVYRKDLKFIGVDFCKKFVNICKDKSLECYQSDIRYTPFTDNYFDNTISIAVIHHLDSREKRIEAINEMIRITKKNGNIFIYVWALEQPENSRRKFYRTDEMVPFKTKDNTYYRYYHLYRKNELEKELSLCNCNYEMIESGYELGNYYIYLKKI